MDKVQQDRNLARCVKAAQVMTAEEKADFESWEKENVKVGDAYGAIDWPGWEAIHARISRLNGHD